MIEPFCIMVSLCRDLGSRAIKALVNTLLLVSLHIHEGHRGLACFMFCVPECGWDHGYALFFYSFFCDFLYIDTHLVSRHYRF